MSMWKMIETARDEDGQGLAEYGLLLLFIAAASVGTLISFRGDVIEFFDDIGSRLIEFL